MPYRTAVVTEITTQLQRVSGYLDGAAPTRVVSARTGQPVADLDTPVADAIVAPADGYHRAAFFEEDESRSVGNSNGRVRGGYVMQTRTIAREDPGFVFLNSRLTRDPGGLGNDTPRRSKYLARPGTAATWGNVSYIDCRIDEHNALADRTGQRLRGIRSWPGMEPSPRGGQQHHFQGQARICTRHLSPGARCSRPARHSACSPPAA
jgi:hypothetical protein